MFLFILPYSKKQHRINLRDCDSAYGLLEFEPFSRLLEKAFSQDSFIAPLYRRFGGPFWKSLEMWVMPPKVMEYINENSYVLSPIYGLVKPKACMPYAPIGWKDVYEGKSLFDFWKPHIKNVSQRLLNGKVVFPFISKEYLSLFDLSNVEKVVSFEYYRKDKKVMNPAKHHAYTLRYIAEKELKLSELHRINFYDYKVEDIREKGKHIYVILRSEGRYEV
ncbi:MAG: peroxide stress protein YaaA [Aquificaceae bacterium]